MNAIEAREVPEALPPIFLQLDSTDFPRRSLPKGLSLPTAARLQVDEQALIIDLIAEEDITPRTMNFQISTTPILQLFP